jgi:hypothetical protein
VTGDFLPSGGSLSVGACEALEEDPIMHVLMVSKAIVNGAYQRKLEEMAQLPGIQLTVLVPPYWRDSRGMIPLQRAYTPVTG